MIGEIIQGFGQAFINLFEKTFSDTVEYTNQLKELRDGSLKGETLLRGDSEFLRQSLDHDGTPNPTEVPIDFFKREYVHDSIMYDPYIGNSGSYGHFVPQFTNAELQLSEHMIDQLWKKMYERPVIVRCSHCNSHNVISNPTCVQCGTPMGDYKRMNAYE